MRVRGLKLFILVTAIIATILWVTMANVSGVPLEFTLANPLMRLYSMLPSRKAVRVALRAHAIAHNQDPDWADAIGWVESKWKLSAIGDNGTSFGPTQLHMPTLTRIGFTGDPIILTTDADKAAEWSAILAEKNNAANFEDFASLWNSGKLYSDLPEDHPTIAYVKAAKEALGTLPVLGDS